MSQFESFELLATSRVMPCPLGELNKPKSQEGAFLRTVLGC